MNAFTARLHEAQSRLHPVGRIVAIAGGVLLIVSAFLPWAYAFSALDGMTLVGNPSPLQRCGLGARAAGRRPRPGRGARSRAGPSDPGPGWVRGAKAAGTGALVFMLLIVAAIALELGGLVNVVVRRLGRPGRRDRWPSSAPS